MSRPELGHAGLLRLTKDELVERVQELRAMRDEALAEAAECSGLRDCLQRTEGRLKEAEERHQVERDRRMKHAGESRGRQDADKQRIEQLEADATNHALQLAVTKGQRDELAGMVRVLTQDETLIARVDSLTSTMLPYREWGT